MTTNREYLDELANRGDGSLTDWFEQEHLEIVRCRDCKHYNTKLTDKYDGTSWCCIHAGYAFPDDYCSWGERRES